MTQGSDCFGGFFLVIDIYSEFFFGSGSIMIMDELDSTSNKSLEQKFNQVGEHVLCCCTGIPKQAIHLKEMTQNMCIWL